MNNLDTTYYEPTKSGLKQIVGLEQCFSSIRRRMEDLIEQNESLRKRNEELLCEHYRDKEIQRLKTELEKTKDEHRFGFYLTPEEAEKANNWMYEHNKLHGPEMTAIGGRYTWEFAPTSIGTICTIKCACGESFNVIDL